MHDPVCPLFEEGKGLVSGGGGEGDKVYKQKVHVFRQKLALKCTILSPFFKIL